jgi:hypothetical protein
MNLIEKGKGVHGNVQCRDFDVRDLTVKTYDHRLLLRSVIALFALALMVPYQLDPLSGAPAPTICASTACA